MPRRGIAAAPPAEGRRPSGRSPGRGSSCRPDAWNGGSVASIRVSDGCRVLLQPFDRALAHEAFTQDEFLYCARWRLRKRVDEAPVTRRLVRREMHSATT